MSGNWARWAGHLRDWLRSRRKRAGRFDVALSLLSDSKVADATGLKSLCCGGPIIGRAVHCAGNSAPLRLAEARSGQAFRLAEARSGQGMLSGVLRGTMMPTAFLRAGTARMRLCADRS